MNKVILLAANRGYALLSSRRELIQRFLDEGWRVVLATAQDEESQKLVELGAMLEPVTFNRGGFSPMGDWKAGNRLRQIISRWKPSIVHFFHAKPVIMGTIAARRELNDNVRIVNTITGLGHAFIQGGLVTRLASAGYRRALPKADVTIFQNRDDWALFLEKKWLSKEKSTLVAGSGIALDRFTYIGRTAHNNTTPVVVMLGRLLNQKGIPEFLEVASRVKEKIPGARFLWAGEEDSVHPDAIDMNSLRSQKSVEYVGRLTDVKPLLSDADLLLFPSYREGVPRAVMEAAATGLPTVAFDVPGVREAVRDKKTGFLVPDRDVDQMTARVFQLLENQELRLDLGRNASQLAKDAFDIRAVQEAYLNIYRELGVDI
jgi:glycosyltransferase involved in cell wall biosynthesis